METKDKLTSRVKRGLTTSLIKFRFLGPFEVKMFLSCSQISAPILGLSSSHSPLSFLLLYILLIFLLLIVLEWKNFVFLSPSFSHTCLDFCLHISSSLT